MGRIANERHIHFYYSTLFMEHWNNQTQDMRDLCNTIGQEHGYSGQNIFYTYLFQYWAHEESGVTRLPYKAAL